MRINECTIIYAVVMHILNCNSVFLCGLCVRSGEPKTVLAGWRNPRNKRHKKKTKRVMAKLRTRVSYLLGQWFSQEQRPQLVP